MPTVTIRNTARNLRFAFTTTPIGRGTIATPEMPARPMSLKAVEEAVEEAARIVSGGIYYNCDLWVGKKRVVSHNCNPISGLSDIRWIANKARNGGAEVVTE